MRKNIATTEQIDIQQSGYAFNSVWLGLESWDNLKAEGNPSSQALRRSQVNRRVQKYVGWSVTN
jgi:hypothetical protein